MFIEIHAITITTHECHRSGQQIEDQRHATTFRIDLAQLAGLLHPLAEMILKPPADKSNGRNGNGVYRVATRE